VLPLNAKLNSGISVFENSIISDLSGLKLISLSRLFADDTSFSYSNRDELQIKTVIDQDLKELDEWSKTLLMSFNPDKSEIMLFSNTDIPEFNFAFNGSTIPITNSHKRLGVTFSR
jgi:hypothetical protein